MIADADRCVKCAVCLPYCPTYRISGNEAESPRGRIALARALADGTQDLTQGMASHLDQCLTCRNCEPVCPARVPYGRLIDETRSEMAARRPLPLLKRFGLGLVTRRRPMRALAGLLRLAQRLRLDRLVPPARRLRPLPDPVRWRDRAPEGDRRGTVGLFVGCVADPLDAATREATADLLAACGYRVRMPAAQTCCGALHQHAGDTVAARRLAEANRACFGETLDAVVSTATGCGAQLAEHVLGENRHEDVCRFLAGSDALPGLGFERLEARVLVHVPCTQRNVLRDTASPAALLRHIPGLTVEAAPEEPRCCGAAGSYVLEHARIADRIGAELAGRIAASEPAFLATANMGCALHLADHLRRLGARTEVLHPVVLLARQLRTAARNNDG